MAPHIEEFTGQYRGYIGDMFMTHYFGGIYAEVPGTRHKHGDTQSPEGIKAHMLLEERGHDVREIRDELGVPCDQESEPEKEVEVQTVWRRLALFVKSKLSE